MNIKDKKKKTEFNNWSISYLSEIFECRKCKKRNPIIQQSNIINSKIQIQNKFQNCLFCGNPNYV